MAEVTEKRIVMPKNVARRWLSRVAQVEYRFKVLLGTKEIRNLPGLLRSFRDRKVGMAGVSPLPDLGVKENFDFIEVWSTDHDGVMRLKDWFEKRGFETTGVW
jgi:hypothetical protein